MLIEIKTPPVPCLPVNCCDEQIDETQKSILAVVSVKNYPSKTSLPIGQASSPYHVSFNSKFTFV
jgi:hypothetical protein